VVVAVVVVTAAAGGEPTRSACEPECVPEHAVSTRRVVPPTPSTRASLIIDV
jgi:hypothetical protein